MKISANKNHVVCSRRVTASIALMLFFMMFFCRTALSSTFQWTGASDTNWTNPANWVLLSGAGSFPNADGDIAQFNGTYASAQNVSVNSAITVGEIDFGTAIDITISGSGTLTVSNTSGVPLISVASGNTGADLISVTLALVGDSINNAVTFNVASGTSLTISGTVRDSAAATNINKTGTGTLTLSGANTYGGVTNVSQGVLQVLNSQALGSTANGTVVSDGAQLELQTPLTGPLAGQPLVMTGESLKLTGTGISGSGALLDIGNNTWGGPITLAANAPLTTPPLKAALGVTNAGDALTVDGVISESGAAIGLDKVGAGRLIFTKTNTYSGQTNVVAGTLRIQNGGALGASSGAAAAATIAATNNSGNGYTALDAVTAGYVPPDSCGAVGPSCYINTVNQNLRLFPVKATGANPITDDFPHFYNTVGGLPVADGGSSFSDPIIVYDELIGRFIIGDQDVDFTSHVSQFNLAVSKTSNPATLTVADWNFYQINTTQANFDADYPGNFGYNADAFVFTLNMFAVAAGPNHVLVTSVSASDLANGVTNANLHFFQNNVNDFSMRASTMHASVSGDPMWLVSEVGDGSHINVWKMTNVLSNSATFTSTSLAVNSYSDVSSAPPLQPDGSSITTNTDSRIQKVASSQGTLVAAHGVSISSTEDDSRWYIIDISGSTPTLKDQGNVGLGNNTYSIYPAIDINSAGYIGMTFDSSGTGTGQFMSAYITGRSPIDPPGTMVTPVLIPTGKGSGLNFDGRQGDLSGINIDPVDGTFWAVNEFTDASNNWGQGIANFSIAAAVNANTVVASGASLEIDGDPTGIGTSISVGEPITLNGTGVGGSGALLNVSGNNIWTGKLTLNSDAAIGVGAGQLLRISGIVQDPNPVPLPPANLTKLGGGRLLLSSVNTYTGITTGQQGDLDVTGTIGNVSLSGGTLSGTGTVGTIVAATSGTVNPGDSSNLSTIGTLSSKAETLANTTCFIELTHTSGGAPVAGVDYDSLFVTGNVSLNNATLSGTVNPNVQLGDSFTIIQATGTVSGTFAAGAQTYLSGRKFQIDYSNTTKVVLTNVKSNATVSVAAVDLNNNSIAGNPSVYGQEVLYIATVTPETGAPAIPTSDTVTFTFDGIAYPAVNVDSNGQATFDPQAATGGVLSVTTPGTLHTLQVSYSGNATTFNSSIGNLAPSQTVNTASTSTSVSATPSVDPVILGQPVTFSATINVIAPGGSAVISSVLTGTGSLLVDGNSVQSGVAVLSNSVTFASISNLTAGAHNIQVVYSGDTNYATSSGTTSINIEAPPTISGTAANQPVADNTTLRPFATVIIGDVDTPPQTLTVTFSLSDTAKGSITSLNGFTPSGGQFTFSGTAAAATTAIQGVVFTPMSNRLPVGQADTEVFTVTANDGIAPTVSDNTSSALINSVNDAPSNVQVQLTASSINENDSTTFSGSFVDPDVQEAHSVSIDWGDGSTATVLPLSANVFTFSAGHKYLNNPAGSSQGSFTIAVAVSDASLTSPKATVSVQVKNVPPTVAINGAPKTVVPGNAIALTSLVTDPGTLDTFTYAWQVTKNGAAFGSGNQPGFSFTPDADGTYMVSLTVTDSDGGTGSANATIQGDTVPSVLSGPSANPSPTFASLNTAFSVAANPADSIVSWDFGDGTPTASGASVNHTFATAGVFSVMVTLQNPRTGSSSISNLSVTVQNVLDGGSALLPGSDPFLPGTTLFRVRKGVIQLTPQTNKISLLAVLHLQAGDKIAGSQLTISVNGVSRTFTLDAKGKGTTANGSIKLAFKQTQGAVTTQEAQYTGAMSGADIPAQLGVGTATDSSGLPLIAVTKVDFNGRINSFVDALHFKVSKTKKTAVFGTK